MFRSLFLVLMLLSTAAWASDPALSAYPGAEGQLLSATEYASSGEQFILLQTESGYYETRPQANDPENIHQNKEIHVYSYARDGEKIGALKFKLYDFVHHCPVAARLDFTGDSPFITDLDEDGVREVWISYYKSCKGDVSPDELKVFMYRKGIKHAIRGTTHRLGEGRFTGGEYKADSRMQKADPRVRRFGEELFRRLAEDR